MLWSGGVGGTPPADMAWRLGVSWEALCVSCVIMFGGGLNDIHGKYISFAAAATTTHRHRRRGHAIRFERGLFCIKYFCDSINSGFNRLHFGKPSASRVQ